MHARGLFAVALFVLGALFQNAAEALPRQIEQEQSIVVGGLKRAYRLYVPVSYKPGNPTPLVLVFHGGSDQSRNIARYSDFFSVAEQGGFIVAFPEGIDKSWHNLGGGEPQTEEDKKVDDVAFVRALIDKIKSEYTIDPRRIYATGMSAGGIFSYLLACKMSDTFAAIAVVSGTMMTTDCPATSPVAVLHIHGKDDENVPLAGGKGRLTFSGRVWQPVATGLEFWRKRNGCADLKTESAVEPQSACWLYPNCSTNKPVSYCLVAGGHQWPGTRERAVWQTLTGTEVDRDFPASEQIWAFFKAHPK